MTERYSEFTKHAGVVVKKKKERERKKEIKNKSHFIYPSLCPSVSISTVHF